MRTTLLSLSCLAWSAQVLEAFYESYHRPNSARIPDEMPIEGYLYPTLEHPHNYPAIPQEAPQAVALPASVISVYETARILSLPPPPVGYHETFSKYPSPPSFYKDPSDTVSAEGSGSDDFKVVQTTTVPTTTTHIETPIQVTDPPAPRSKSAQFSFKMPDFLKNSLENLDLDDEKKPVSPLSRFTSLLNMVNRMKEGIVNKALEEGTSRSSSVSNLESNPIMGTVNSMLDGLTLSVKEDGKEEVNPLEPLKKLMKDMMSKIVDAKSTFTKTILSKSESSTEITEESNSGRFVLEDAKKPSRGVGSFLSLLNGQKKKEAAASEIRGPHICVKEMNKKHKGDNRTINLEKECEIFPQAVRCVQKRMISEGWLETTRIQECCEGFASDDITKGGCGKELVPESLDKLILKYNLSNVPSDLLTSTIMFSKNSSKEVFPTRLMDYDLIDGAILTSVDQKKFVISHDKEEKSTHVNCVLLNRTNIFLENGMAMISDEDVSPAANTILELLEKDGRFKTFLSILSSEMKEKLGSPSTSVNVMPFTDESFETFTKEIQKQLKSNKSCVVKTIEKFHIFDGAVCAHKLLSSSSPAEIIKTSSETLFIGGAKIVETDGVALNGIIHVVDEVIAKEQVESWVEKLKEIDPLLTTLFNDEVKDKEPISILVPTVSKLQNIDDALNHVIPLKITSLDEEYPSSITTEGNSTIFVEKFPQSRHGSIFGSLKSSAPLQFGCSRVVSHPKVHKKLISACGSSIIFLDKPLPVVNSTMEEFLASRPEISRFASLFDTFSFNHTLPRVSTLFIPVDDAFAVNSYKKLKNDPKQITNLIKTHLVSRPICEHDIDSCKTEVRGKIVNEHGKSLNVGGEKGGRSIGNSKILETVVVSDGVVHLMEDIISMEVPDKKNKKSSFSPFSILDDGIFD